MTSTSSSVSVPEIRALMERRLELEAEKDKLLRADGDGRFRETADRNARERSDVESQIREWFSTHREVLIDAVEAAHRGDEAALGAALGQIDFGDAAE